MAASRAGVFLASLFAVYLSVSLSGSSVRAADVTDVVAGVRFSSPTCPITPVAMTDLVEALRVELASRARGARAQLVTLTIKPCDVGTTNVHVEVTEELTGRASVRDVGLEDVAPAARTRALALAVAELVRAADTTVVVAVSPVEPRRLLPPPAPHAAPPPPPRGAFGVEAVASLYPARSTALWGGRLRVGAESPVGHTDLFLEAVTGTRHLDEGDVTVRSVGAGLALGGSRRAGPVQLQPAFVAALGYTKIAGHAAAPDVTVASGEGLTVSLRLRLAVALPVAPESAWSVHAFVEGGFVARRFDALVDGARVAGVAGPSVILGVGGAYASP
jgi:hypothetical protein